MGVSRAFARKAKDVDQVKDVLLRATAHTTTDALMPMAYADKAGGIIGRVGIVMSLPGPS
jgi:hypothetical protein